MKNKRLKTVFAPSPWFVVEVPGPEAIRFWEHCRTIKKTFLFI